MILGTFRQKRENLKMDTPFRIHLSVIPVLEIIGRHPFGIQT